MLYRLNLSAVSINRGNITSVIRTRVARDFFSPMVDTERPSQDLPTLSPLCLLLVSLNLSIIGRLRHPTRVSRMVLFLRKIVRSCKSVLFVRKIHGNKQLETTGSVSASDCPSLLCWPEKYIACGFTFPCLLCLIPIETIGPLFRSSRSGGKRKSDDVHFRPVSSGEIGAPRLVALSRSLQEKEGTKKKGDVGPFCSNRVAMSVPRWRVVLVTRLVSSNARQVHSPVLVRVQSSLVIEAVQASAWIICAVPRIIEQCAPMAWVARPREC